MILRFILSILLFLCSLLVIFPVPAHQVWYLGVAVSEFSWVWLICTILTLTWNIHRKRYRIVPITFCTLAILLYLFPIVSASIIGSRLNKKLETAFGINENDMNITHQHKAFSLLQLFTINRSKKVTPVTYHYAVHTGVDLTLDHYPAQTQGIRPCLVVVHGGSWAKGDSKELSGVNDFFALDGYQVVSINYRLAPTFKSPAPQEDLQAAIAYLKQNAAALKIDTTRFVLMGRSAGGQIVLNAAYSLHDPGIKGVISFYGPTDMIWSYDHPDNPLIMDSKKVLRDFVGGSPEEVKEKYLAASPMEFVTSTTVPTLLIHGRNDAHVYQKQAYRLKEKLDAAHVKNFFLALPWATHGCEFKLSTPSGQLSAYCMERFLYAVTK